MVLFKITRRTMEKAQGRKRCTRCFRTVLPKRDTQGRGHCPACGAFMCDGKNATKKK